MTELFRDNSNSFKSSNDAAVNETPVSNSSEESTFIIKKPSLVCFSDNISLTGCGTQPVLKSANLLRHSIESDLKNQSVSKNKVVFLKSKM